jgi:hypothetical protein
MPDVTLSTETKPRRYLGFAGHLVVSDSCRFHLTTHIGDVLISTVGAYEAPVIGFRPEDPASRFTDIGYRRKYETMVFVLGDALCPCGCGERLVGNWSEVDFAGYNSPREATEGHEAMCVKWAHGIAPAPEPAEDAAPVAAGEES